MDKWLAGVDLGGTSTKIAFIDTSGKIIDKWKIPTDNSSEGKNIIPNISMSIDRKLAELGRTKEILAGIGMGAPGPVNLDKGIIYNTVNLGWKDNYPLKERLEAETLLPAVVNNDANCAALGEMWQGAGKGAKNIVCVTLGTGIGGGVIINGDIIQGALGSAGEIGHITSIANGGALCNCGKTGCLETVASATGIVRQAMERLNESDNDSALAGTLRNLGSITAKDVFDAAKNGDGLARTVIKETVQHLGIALANIGNILNPEKIILGGGVSSAGDFLLNQLREYFKKYAFRGIKASTEIVLAALGNDAGIIGAGWLAKNHLSCSK